MHVRDLPEFAPLLAMDRSGPGAWMAVSLVSVTPGRPRLASWPSGLWSGIWVLTLLIVLGFGMLLDSGMLMIWPLEWRNTLVSRLMGAENSISLVVLRFLVPVYTFLLLRRPIGFSFGVPCSKLVIIGIPSFSSFIGS